MDGMKPKQGGGSMLHGEKKGDMDGGGMKKKMRSKMKDMKSAMATMKGHMDDMAAMVGEEMKGEMKDMD